MKYPIFGNTSTVPSSATNVYQSISPSASGAFAWAAGNTSQMNYLLRPLVFSNATWETVGSPGAGKSYDLSLATGATALLTATLSDANTIARSSAGARVRIEAGSHFILKSVPTGTPAALTNMRWSFLVDTLGDPHCQIFTSYNAPSNVLTTYGPILWGGVTNNASATSSVVAGRMAGSGVIKEIRYDIRDAPGAGKTWTFSIIKNGVEEASSVVTLSNPTKTTTLTGLSIAYTNDDEIVVKHIPSGVPTSTYTYQTLLVLPDVPGTYPYCTSAATLNTGAVRYARAASNYASTITPETNAQNITPTGLVAYYKNFRCKVSTDPGGAGKSWTSKMLVNSSAVNNSVVIGNGTTSAADTSNIDAVGGEKNLVTEITPAGTPAAVTTYQYYLNAFVHPEVPCML